MKKVNYVRVIFILVSLTISLLIVHLLPKDVKKNDNFIEIAYSIKTNDEILCQVFYTYIGGNKEFNESDSKIMLIEGSESYNKVNFILPCTEITNFRLDFGTKPGSISIRELMIKKGKDILTFSPEQISNIFKKNQIDNMIIEGDSLKIISDKSDPFIFPVNPVSFGSSTDANSGHNTLGAIFILCSIIIYIILYLFWKYILKFRLNIANIVISIVFLIIIYLPLFFTNNNDISIVENRDLAQFPNITKDNIMDSNFTNQFSDWFNDHYGLREILIKFNSLLNVKVLKTSSNKDVLMGKDEWLFYANKEDGDSISCYQNLNLFNREELNKIQENLVNIRDWCKKQGADFLLVIPPNKETIYQEMYPTKIKKIGEQSRLDQLVEYMNTNTDLNIIDIRSDLLSEKSRAQLYYRTDTHWNNYGAYIGYQAIQRETRKIYPQIIKKNKTDYNISKIYTSGGDLANMLFLSTYFDDTQFEFLSKSQVQYKTISEANGIGGIIITQSSNSSLPKAVMIRDSFATSLIQFISNDFSRIVYDWNNAINPDLIKSEKPDIVIYEIVERKIGFLANDISDEIK